MSETINFLNSKLAKANLLISDLKVKLAYAKAGQNHGQHTAYCAPVGSTYAPHSNHYCWTHGIHCSHPSSNSPGKSPGHIDSATKANMQGGNANPATNT